MPNPNYTHIEFLLDRSGSMFPMMNTVIEGYNSFLNANKQLPGKLTSSMRQFSTDYVDTFTMASGHEIPELSHANYRIGGSTALIDAAVDAIDRLGTSLAELPEDERPGKVVFVVYTDGEENASRFHTASELSARIKEQEEIYKWEFVYLGAHPNAFGAAGNLGFDVRKIGGYEATHASMSKSFKDVSASVISYRSGHTKEVLIAKET